MVGYAIHRDQKEFPPNDGEAHFHYRGYHVSLQAIQRKKIYNNIGNTDINFIDLCCTIPSTSKPSMIVGVRTRTNL